MAKNDFSTSSRLPRFTESAKSAKEILVGGPIGICIPVVLLCQIPFPVLAVFFIMVLGLVLKASR